MISLAESEFVLQLGWTLLHSLWQIAMVGIVFSLASAILGRSSRARYNIACAGLACVIACPILTFYFFTPPKHVALSHETSAQTEGGSVTVEEPIISVDIEERTPVPIEDLPVTDVDAIGDPQSQSWDGPNGPPSANEATDPPPPLDLETASSVKVKIQTPDKDRPSEATSNRWTTFWIGAARSSVWLTPVWIIGVLILGIRNLGGWRLAQLASKSSEPLEEGRLYDLFQRVLHRMDVRRCVRLCSSAKAVGPMIVGAARPVLLIPASLATGLTFDQWEAIFAHELAHVRRWDYLANLLQTVVETLLFYHPTVWRLSRRIRIERENCCDDWATQVCGEPLAMADALTAIETFRAKEKGSRPSPAVGVRGEGKTSLTFLRVRRLLGFPEPGGAGRKAPWLAGAVVLLLLVAGGISMHVSSRGDELTARDNIEDEVPAEVEEVVDDPEWGEISYGVAARLRSVEQIDAPEDVDWPHPMLRLSVDARNAGLDAIPLNNPGVMSSETIDVPGVTSAETADWLDLAARLPDNLEGTLIDEPLDSSEGYSALQRPWLRLPGNGMTWQIEVDGQWYENIPERAQEGAVIPETQVDGLSENILVYTEIPIHDREFLDFEAGREYEGLTLDVGSCWYKIPEGKESNRPWTQFGVGSGIRIPLGGEEQTKPEQLILTSGVHKIRVALPCSGHGPTRFLRVVTNELEVEIEGASQAEEPEWGEISYGVAARLRSVEQIDAPEDVDWPHPMLRLSVDARNAGLDAIPLDKPTIPLDILGVSSTETSEWLDIASRLPNDLKDTLIEEASDSPEGYSALKRPWLYLVDNGLTWQIEVDGVWYAHAPEWNPGQATLEGIVLLEESPSHNGELLDFEAGREHEGMTFDVGSRWYEIPEAEEEELAAKIALSQVGLAGTVVWPITDEELEKRKQLFLTSGSHRIRVALTCPQSKAQEPLWTLRVVTNELEVEIEDTLPSGNSSADVYPYGLEIDDPTDPSGDYEVIVTQVDENGEITDSPLELCLWKSVSDPNLEDSYYYYTPLSGHDYDAKWLDVWTDDDAEFTVTDLSKGVYRFSTISPNGYGDVPQSTYLGEPFVIDGSSPQVIVEVPVGSASPLLSCKIDTILLNEETGDAVQEFDPGYAIYHDGIPWGWASNRRDASSQEANEDEIIDGFEIDLAPGYYELGVQNVWHKIGKNTQALADTVLLPFTVAEGETNEFRFEILSQNFKPESDEVQARWPYLVEGRVTLTDGQPVEGADVRIAQFCCAFWDTWAKGKTDAEGQYQLRFRARDRNITYASRAIENANEPGSETANLLVEIEGCFETSSGLSGRLIVSDEFVDIPDNMPELAARICSPEQPVRNFDLQVASVTRLECELIGPDGNVLEAERILHTTIAPSDGEIFGGVDGSVRAGGQTSPGRFAIIVPTYSGLYFKVNHKQFGTPEDLVEAVSLEPVFLSRPGAWQLKMQTGSVPELEDGAYLFRTVELIDPDGAVIISEDNAELNTNDSTLVAPLHATAARYIDELFIQQKYMGSLDDEWPFLIARSFENRCGPFQKVLSYQTVETLNGEYVEARGRWEDAVMLIRLTFEEQENGSLKVVGFWLARDEEGPTPVGFQQGGYILGEPMMQIAGLDGESNLTDHTIAVKQVDEDGEATDSPLKLILWKKTTDPDAGWTGSMDYFIDADGAGWQAIKWMRNASHTWEHITTGVYRITSDPESDLGHAFPKRDGIIGSPFRVDGTQQEVEVEFSTVRPSDPIRCSLKAVMVDADSGDWLHGFTPSYKLYRQGVPRIQNPKRMDMAGRRQDDGNYETDLAPGEWQVSVYGYQLVGIVSITPGLSPRQGVFSFTVVEGEANDFLFTIPKPVSDSDEVIPPLDG
jgi:hypothetical protein